MLRVHRGADPPPEWEDLWRADPRSTLFTHPRWMAAIGRAFPGDRPRYLTVSEGRRTVGMIPLVRRRRYGLDQYLSLPFGTHGGPLLAPDAGPDAVPALARAFRRLVTGLRVMRFEMSVFNPDPGLERGLSAELGDWLQPRVTHLVDLRVGFDELWNHRYHKNTRNCVRMAERAEVAVAEESGEEALAILHRLQEEQSRGWEGIRPYTLDQLRSVRDSFGADARLYVARLDGQALAACLFLEHKGRETRPWVSGASAEARPVRAFHLLLNTAVRDACGRGFEVWDFGGSGGNKGIEFFKESFGGVSTPVLRFFHVADWVRRVRRVPAWD